MNDSNIEPKGDQNPGEENLKENDSNNSNRRTIPRVNEKLMKLMYMFSAGIKSAAEDELESEKEE